MLRLLFSLLLCFTVHNVLAQCDVTAGLIHKYDLNGNGLDAVGGNNATLGISGVSYVADRFGNATSAVSITNNNRSIVPAAAIAFQNEMTFCFWARFTSQPANAFNGRVFNFSTAGSIALWGDSNTSASSVGSFGIFYQLPAGGFYSWANPAPTLNDWHFVAITKQDTLFSLYVDNQFVASRKPYYYNGTTTSFNALLGREGFPTNPLGQFDDFRVYNRVLPQSAMDTIYYGATPVITKHPNSQTVCPNLQNYILSVQSNISHLGGTTFQWYKNNTPINGATNDTLLLSNFIPSDSGTYKVTVANFCGVTATSNDAVIRYNSFDLNTNLAAYYAFAGGNPSPSNSGSPMTATTLQSGLAISFVANRWGSGSQSLRMGNKQSGLIYQSGFNDSTSTISLWYRYNTLGNTSNSYILGVAGTASAKGIQSCLMVNTSNVLGLYNGAFVPSTITLANDVWYHIVVVRNGSNAKIYVDKNLVLEVNNAYNLFNYPIKYLGNTGNIGTANPVDGALGTYEDVRFYNEPFAEEGIYYLFSEMHFTQNVRRVASNTTLSTPQTICDSTNLQLQSFTNSSNTTTSKKYRWLKNGIYLSDNANYTGTQTSTLNINYFTIADTGTYSLESSIDCYKTLIDPANSLKLLHSDTNGVQLVIDSLIQPMCTGQFAKMYFHPAGNDVSSLVYITIGPSVVNSPLLTLAPNSTFTFYVNNNSFTCRSTKTVSTLPILNTLSANANAPLFSGDSIIIKTNASVYKPSFSWSGAAGVDNDSVYNKANALSAQSGVYTVTVTNGSACTMTTTVNVLVNSAIVISPKVFLSGPYSTSTGLMHDSLRSKNLIPLVEPYSSLPYSSYLTHVNSGGETTLSSIFSVTGNNAIVDWVFVELRDKNNSANVLATKSALLQRDGDVVDARNGTSPVSFTGVVADNYFVSIRHRNHLGVMTKFSGSLSETAVNVDFTSLLMPLHRRTVNNNNFVYSSTQDSCTRKLGTTTIVRALYAGNTNLATTGVPAQYRQIKYNGVGSDRLTLLSLTSTSGSIIGYLKEDVNMTGDAKYNGINNDRLVLLQNIGTNSSNTVYEQLPY